MSMKKVILCVESVLCLLCAAIPAGGAVRIFLEGMAERAGNPGADIYTVERIRKYAAPALPVFLAAAVLALIYSVLVRREKEAGRREGTGMAKASGANAGRRQGTGAEKASGSKSQQKAAAAYSEPEDREGARDRRCRTAAVILLVISVLCIVIGILNGSMSDVLIKAVNICTECIGLG